MIEFLTDPAVWLSMSTLSILEIVLGIDNIIFITILASNLPEEMRKRAQVVGLSAAMVTRVLMLFGAYWIIQLDDDIATLGNFHFSGRDLILIAGGIFLIYKSVTEIHENLEGEEGKANPARTGAKAFAAIIGQILVLDIVFSIDGIITAVGMTVGMTNSLTIMIVAVVVSSIAMLFAANWVGDFVTKHPTVKMLALAFLVLIGASLVAEGFGSEIDKAFIYGPMAFAVIVEALNITAKNRRQRHSRAESEPVDLHDAIVPKRTRSVSRKPSSSQGTSAK